MEPLHDNEEARVTDAAEIEDPEAAARAARSLSCIFTLSALISTANSCSGLDSSIIPSSIR